MKYVSSIKPKKGVESTIKMLVRAKWVIKKSIVDRVNKIIMNEENIWIALAGVISALGLKEVWSIIKQKIDIGAKKEEREENVYSQQIEILTNKIQQLENKIELLIEENIQLRIKVAKMSERLVTNAKKRVQKRNKNE